MELFLQRPCIAAEDGDRRHSASVLSSIPVRGNPATARDISYARTARGCREWFPPNTRARNFVDEQPRTEGLLVFPSPPDPSRPRDDDLSPWNRVRGKAGIGDVHLHDLRRSSRQPRGDARYAGAGRPRRFGHWGVRRTLRYARLGDRDFQAPAEIQVETRIRFNSDGTMIGSPRAVDRRSLAAHPAFRAYGESVARALQNPRCQPFRLSPDPCTI